MTQTDLNKYLQIADWLKGHYEDLEAFIECTEQAIDYGESLDDFTLGLYEIALIIVNKRGTKTNDIPEYWKNYYKECAEILNRKY